MSDKDLIQDMDKVLALPRVVTLHGVDFNFYPVRLRELTSFMECAPILRIEKSSIAFSLTDGEDLFDKVMQIVLHGDPIPLKDVALATDWDTIRKTIIDQNDLPFGDEELGKEKNIGGLEGVQNLT